MDMEERRQLLSKAAAGASAEIGRSLKSMPDVDKRTKMQLEHFTKNVLFNLMAVVATGGGGTGMVTAGGGSGAGPVDAPSAAINVSIVAKEMCFKLTDAQLQRVRRKMQ
jgi:hypothetical protein